MRSEPASNLGGDERPDRFTAFIRARQGLGFIASGSGCFGMQASALAGVDIVSRRTRVRGHIDFT